MSFLQVWKIISIYNWMCFLVANLQFILLNQCQLQFFCAVPSTYGGQSNDLLFALDSVSIDWVSSCVPLSSIYTWCLSMWTTTVLSEGSRQHCWTDVDLRERAGSCLTVSQTLSLKFLPALPPSSLATLVCCTQGESVCDIVTVLNC